MERVQTIVTRITSPKRVLAFACGSLSLLAFARVTVLIVESYSAVRSERDADWELLRLCDAGTASMSNDFRSLCMKKRAEMSAPVLLKALLRACGTAFADFCECFSSPTKIVLLILFCLTGVAAPVVKALSQLVVDSLKRRRRGRKAHDSDDEDSDDDETGHQEIVVVRSNDDMNYGSQLMSGNLGMRLRRSMRNMRRGRSFATTPLALANLPLDEDVTEWS
jgi:hypothetical protein